MENSLGESVVRRHGLLVLILLLFDSSMVFESVADRSLQYCSCGGGSVFTTVSFLLLLGWMSPLGVV